MSVRHGKCFTLGQTTLLTGLGFLSGRILPLVTGSLNLVCYVSVLTFRASIGGISVFLTGRLGYNCLIGVSLCKNFFLLNESFTTNGTDSAIGKSCFGTCCFLTCYKLLGVSECINCFLCSDSPPLSPNSSL